MFNRKNDKAPETEECSLGRLFTAFWQFLGPQRKRYTALAVLCTITAACGNLLPTAGLGYLNTLYLSQTKDYPQIYWVITFVSLTALIFGFMNREINRKLSAVSDRILYEMRVSGYTRLMMQSYTEHQKELAGEKIQKINQGILDLQKLLVLLSGRIFNQVATVVGVFVIFAFLSPLFIPALLGIFGLVYAPERYYYKPYKDAQRRRTKARERSSGTFTEAITNVFTIKALGAEKGLRTVIEEAELEGLNASAEVLAIARKKSILFQLTKALGLWSALMLITYLVSTGNLVEAYALAYVMYYMRMFNNADELSDTVNEMIAIRVGVSRMLAIYDLQEPEDGTEVLPPDWEVLHVDNVSFAYPGNESEKLALDRVTMKFERGKKVGITGPTGSGKSTLAKLLHGIEKPTLGSIHFDGLPFEAIMRYERAANITGVPQETQLFKGTLAENITFFEKPDPDRLKQAIELAQLEKVVASLPKKADSKIGEQGHNLSGGQRQRLSLARAHYSGAGIIILDEPTSNLDYRTERLVQKALESKTLDKTLIMNAHRLSTLRAMDYIYVIDEGSIIEEGTYEELEGQEGGYINSLNKAEKFAVAHH